ncbi:uridine kinase [Legionella gresilensis]|uniref:uridine kinase n=1 Tax=Legionella gresilensis TaxID=91823 RepID=UPI00104177EB|nr:uridine kinase [Legionella gresilensis]
MAHVIGISGNMGAGKTTLTLALAESLDASYLLWDDFDEISISPNDYIDWYKRGQDYSEWNYQKLAQTLNCLKCGKLTLHPALNILIKPTSFIIFDAPLGRFHQQTGIFIDTWIHINTPLDISLCRWLLRDYTNPTKTKQDLLNELTFYLDKSRPLFDDRELKANADLVVDGLLPIRQQVIVINRVIKNKNEASK